MQIRGKNMQFPGFETLKTVIFRYATFFGSEEVQINCKSKQIIQNLPTFSHFWPK